MTGWLGAGWVRTVGDYLAGYRVVDRECGPSGTRDELEYVNMVSLVMINNPREVGLLAKGREETARDQSENVRRKTLPQPRRERGRKRKEEVAVTKCKTPKQGRIRECEGNKLSPIYSNIPRR